MEIIKTIQQFREAVAVGADLEYKRIKPLLRAAEQKLIPYLGRELLEELSAANLSPDLQALAPLVMAPVANIALIAYVGSNNVSVSDVGLVRTKSANTNDAFEWQVDRTIQALKESAWEGIENLLGYLEVNAQKFTSYTESAAYTSQKSQLVPSAQVFTEIYEINGSRLVFESLRSAMNNAFFRVIEPILGDRLSDILPDDANAVNLKIRKVARMALVYMTIYRALNERQITLTDAGVQVLSISQFATLRYTSAPTPVQIANALEFFKAESGSLVTALISLAYVPTDQTEETARRVLNGSIVSF